MREILLRAGRVTQVDDEDFEFLNQWLWGQYSDGYVSRQQYIGDRRVRIFMHRVIVNTPAGMKTDHWDRDKLNNQKHNLRVCTHRENMRNAKKKQGSSAFKGVCFHIASGRWMAQIQNGRTKMYLGLFRFEEDAARAYDSKARELHGEFARLNFPVSNEMFALVD